jgi:hypothetical protein
MIAISAVVMPVENGNELIIEIDIKRVIVELRRHEAP